MLAISDSLIWLSFSPCLHAPVQPSRPGEMRPDSAGAIGTNHAARFIC